MGPIFHLKIHTRNNAKNHTIHLNSINNHSLYPNIRQWKTNQNQKKKVSLNTVQVVWLGMRWRRWRTSKTRWWNRISKYLSICTGILSSLVPPQVVTSKTKKQAKDYQRQRDHHDHTHLSLLNYISCRCF